MFNTHFQIIVQQLRNWFPTNYSSSERYKKELEIFLKNQLILKSDPTFSIKRQGRGASYDFLISKSIIIKLAKDISKLNEINKILSDINSNRFDSIIVITGDLSGALKEALEQKLQKLVQKNSLSLSKHSKQIEVIFLNENKKESPEDLGEEIALEPDLVKRRIKEFLNTKIMKPNEKN